MEMGWPDRTSGTEQCTGIVEVGIPQAWILFAWPLWKWWGLLEKGGMLRKDGPKLRSKISYEFASKDLRRWEKNLWGSLTSLNWRGSEVDSLRTYYNIKRLKEEFWSCSHLRPQLSLELSRHSFCFLLNFEISQLGIFLFLNLERVFKSFLLFDLKGRQLLGQLFEPLARIC